MYQIDFNHPIHIYFVGIGGISMSGLAEILREKGFQVSGSDRQASPLTKSLEEKGITVFYGQRAANITPDIDCAVFTSAIHPDNPENIAIHKLGIHCLVTGNLFSFAAIIIKADHAIDIKWTVSICAVNTFDRFLTVKHHIITANQHADLMPIIIVLIKC